MTTFTKRFGTGLLCVLATALAACSGSGSDTQTNNPSQIEPPAASNVGYFSLSVSDAPIKDATKVCIRFDGVELKHADSDDMETIDFDEPKVINLLAYQGDDSHPIVTGAEVPAGNYQWIRLKVTAERGLGVTDGNPMNPDCDDGSEGSYLVRNTSDVYNLFIPSGSQRGLQLIKDITIPANRTGEFTAEWDLGKSFNSPPGLLEDVMMKPVVKLVANNEVGTLTGQVADGLITLDSCDDGFVPSVYVYDDGVTPNPFDDPFAEDDAVATGMVERVTMDDGLTQWRYTIGFLLAGNYEAAYTCNGTDFIPLVGKPAEIVVDGVETVNFDFEEAPGTLVGQVASAFFDPAAPESVFCDTEFAPMVYVFAEGVEPNFVDAPVATGEVSQDSTTEQYGYSIPLQAGNYNAAFSCTGTDFIPVAGKAAEILPATPTTVDFLTDAAPPLVGSLSGSVADALFKSETCAEGFDPAVYVFEEGVTPNGVDTPVKTGLVAPDSQTETNRYLIEDLVADTYTAAFTCTGTEFTPEDGKPAVISAGEEQTVDF